MEATVITEKQEKLRRSANVIDEYAEYAMLFFARFGWYLVFGAITVYFVQPYLHRWVNDLSTAHANRESRKAILDEDRKRARMLQQLDVYKANRLHRDKDVEAGSSPASKQKGK